MEEVLEVYTPPYDPRRPWICMDEVSKQLVGETCQPLPAEPGQASRYDYEYQRNGVCNLFMFFDPLQGWRHVEVTERRTMQDWAWALKAVVEGYYPSADVVTVVLDNLNTHVPAALYATFPPAEARRLRRRLEFVYTPKHGSWLNMAEIELSVLSRQCLNRRLADRDTLTREVIAWEVRRNATGVAVDWRFTTATARIKLQRLYPVIHD
jgi:DDE superfamily endonuclease